MNAKNLARTLSLSVVAALAAGGVSVAEVVFWDGNYTLDGNGFPTGGGFSWNDPLNWSTGRAADGSVNIDPVDFPDADDIGVWARDLGVQTSIFMGGDRELAAYVVDLATPSQFPFMGQSAGSPVTLTVGGTSLVGTDFELPSFDNGSVVISSTTSHTSAASIDWVLGGSGSQVVRNDNGVFKIDGSLLGDAGLEKVGFGTLRVLTDYGVTGDLLLRQGVLDFENGFNIAQFGSGLTVTDDSEGAFKFFELNDGQEYIVASLDVKGTQFGPGTYSAADFASFGNAFRGAGTITVIPEPSAVCLLGLGGLLMGGVRRMR